VSRRARADVVVIGGGVIGCAIAWEAAQRGLSVVVAERDSPGRRATWAAAGMLSPLGEAGTAGPFLDLADASLQLFAAFADGLQQQSGIDIEYRTNGKLHVALDGADASLRALAATPAAQRFEVRLLDGDGARGLEPALSERVTAALLVGRDHRVNNRLLAQALLSSATASGVTFRTANPVASIIARHETAAGVRLLSGDQIDADSVVMAAGAWSGQIDGLTRVLPIRPVKGQMFAVDTRDRTAQRGSQQPLQRVLYGDECYIIPRDDGRLLVGATVEDVGFRKGATPRGIGALISAASAMLPMVADLPLVETWAGFRPATPDGLPILGTDPSLRKVLYATGHFRNGILLAPVTARIIADLLTGQAPPVALEPFSVGRFPRL
jgi:glycine oxidase